MAAQLTAFKVLTLFMARDQRENVKQLQADAEQLMETFDRFYALLGKRNWVSWTA